MSSTSPLTVALVLCTCVPVSASALAAGDGTQAAPRLILVQAERDEGRARRFEAPNAKSRAKDDEEDKRKPRSSKDGKKGDDKAGKDRKAAGEGREAPSKKAETKDDDKDRGRRSNKADKDQKGDKDRRARPAKEADRKDRDEGRRKPAPAEAEREAEDKKDKKAEQAEDKRAKERAPKKERSEDRKAEERRKESPREDKRKEKVEEKSQPKAADKRERAEPRREPDAKEDGKRTAKPEPQRRERRRLRDDERRERAERQRRKEERKTSAKELTKIKVEKNKSVTIDGGERVLRRAGDRIIVRSDDRHRFDRGRRRDERLDGGRTRTVVSRPDGSEVITVRDRDGEIIRRARRMRDGREIVIINNDVDVNYIDRRRDQRDGRDRDRDRRGDRWRDGDRYDRDRRHYWDRDYRLELGPLRITIPRERYIVESRHASRHELEEALMAPPVEHVERPYSLEEVRWSDRLRDKMRRVDVTSITFDTDSAVISPDQVDQLDELGYTLETIIEQHPDELFLIEGHTDAVGSGVYNLALSDRRAESVAIALSDHFNVPPENLVTQGYGEDYLKIPTSGPERANRRVTVRRITPLMRSAQR